MLGTTGTQLPLGSTLACPRALQAQFVQNRLLSLAGMHQQDAQPPLVPFPQTHFQANQDRVLFTQDISQLSFALRMKSEVVKHCCLVAKSCPTLLGPYRLEPARLHCPRDFSGKNTGVGCHFLLQGIFLTQGLTLHLLHWQVDSLPLSHQGSAWQM